MSILKKRLGVMILWPLGSGRQFPLPIFAVGPSCWIGKPNG
jgi:hypothetical protein